MQSIRSSLFQALALLLLTSSPLFAQATGTITGSVLDQDGLVLPGATVIAENTATGVTRETVTTGAGSYTMPALLPGPYRVQAELPGFDTAISLAAVVSSSTVTVDLQMGIATLEETLIVTAATPLIEVTQSVVANTIRQEEVRELPMLNRSLAAMMTLLPGAREVAAGGSHGHASNYVSFAGNTGRSYNMYVDGIDNKEDQDGGTLLQYSLDGIEEFRALGAGFQAEYGRGSTVVTLATRSGTNEFTGSGFLQGRNQSMGATDYFSNTENDGFGEQPFQRLQFGGSIGGPIVRDRAWVFSSAESIRQEFKLPRSAGILAEHQILEEIGIVPGVVANPSMDQPFRDYLFQVRGDFRLTDNQSGFLKLATQNGFVNNATWNGPQHMDRDPFISKNDQTMYAVVGGHTWVPNNSSVNEFRMQYMYYLHEDINGAPCDFSAPWSECVQSRLSFPSVGTDRPFFAHEDWVNFETKFEIVNNFSKQIGRHYIKVGGDIALLPTFYANLMVFSPGRIQFWDDPSVIVGNTNGLYPQGFQTPGIVRSIIVSSKEQIDAWSRDSWFFAGYIQDDFQVTPQLTLNLGLRYDVNEMMDNGVGFEANRSRRILEEIGHPYGAQAKTDTNNWGPRLGAAYDVRGDGSDVVRGSFGLFYATGIITSAYGRGLIQQENIFIRATTANSGIGVGPLADFVFGVDEVPVVPDAPTEFPAGANTAGSSYHPDFADAYSINSSFGISHLFGGSTVLSVDYLNVLIRNGWRNYQINPYVVDPVTGGNVRALAADLDRVFGDPKLLGPSGVLCSCNRGRYDAVDVHFEHRLEGGSAFQVNYTLGYARGMGGSTDFTTQGAFAGPENQDGFGESLNDDTEWGPTAYDERHRVTLAGSFPLPGGFSIAPLVTIATARPYTAYSGYNEFGIVQFIKDENGDSAGPYNTRGKALMNLNARITKRFDLLGGNALDVFGEFYNITNRANFGNSYNGFEFSSAYGTPTGFLGGIGSTSTLPVSFQMQVGVRYDF